MLNIIYKNVKPSSNLLIQLNFRLLLCFIICYTSDTYALEDRFEIDQRMNTLINNEQLAGIVYAGINIDEFDIASAGFANISENMAMSPSHKVQVGSITKTVLATAILRMVSQGSLSLDSPIKQWLPELNIINPWNRNTPITVKHLLEHTAGLDNIRMWQFLNSSITEDTPLQNAFLHNNHLLKVRTKPGSQYSYSNMGYTLLAMIIEKVTHTRYEDHIAKSVFEPLKMHGSSLHFISQVKPKKDKNLAMGYFDLNTPQQAIPMYLRPAGQLTTTASDMLKFMHFLLADGQLNDETFIEKELMQRLGKPHDTHAQKNGLDIGHGLVFASRDRHGVLGLCHPGTTFGFRANMCLFPQQKKAFFYAINTDSETANYEAFNRLFIKHLQVRAQSSPTVTPINDSMEKYQGWYLPSPNNMQEFALLDLLFGFRYVTKSAQQWQIKSLQNQIITLKPLNKGLFISQKRTQASHVFYENDNGELLLSDGLNTYKKQPIFILGLYWLSLILAAFGLAYIIIISLLRLFSKNLTGFKASMWPFINICALAIPFSLYMQQPFLKFGELTAASISLAVVTAALPLSLLISLITSLKKQKTNLHQFDFYAALMLLQFCFVLIYWDLLPLIFWQ